MPRGPGYWKLDNTLLTDPTFVGAVTEHITEVLTEDLENPNSKWELVKFKIIILHGIRSEEKQRTKATYYESGKKT